MVASAGALTARTWPREVRTLERKPATGPTRSAQVGVALVDAGLLLGFVYALPFIIILVGAPVALTLKLLLWLGGVQ